MRPIKFRAFDINYKKMLTPKQLEDSGVHLHASGCLFITDINDKEILCERLEAMQFTGLHDKNGREIYEGDLVRVQSQYETEEPVDSSPNRVYFRDGAFRCGFHDIILGEKVCSGSEGNWNMEVIGNIHEHPELVNPEKGVGK